MKKKFLFMVTLCVFLCIGGMKTSAEDGFISKNSVIEVGDKLYVQHDEENNNIYELKKSDTGITVVYENILPEFTASKAWTTKGDYIDDIFKEPVGATSPEHYIPVQAGEEYFIKTYGVGWTGSWDFFYAPVLFLDEKDNVVADALTNTLSKSKSGVVVTFTPRYWLSPSGLINEAGMRPRNSRGGNVCCAGSYRARRAECPRNLRVPSGTTDSSPGWSEPQARGTPGRLEK
ncbi:MAG: hypothetical protein II295_04285 [Akkermansia sp.]|nr:hypothetical protein [Akkermansia sp.]